MKGKIAMYNYRDDRTDREKELEWELEDARAKLEQRERDEREARERRRREDQEQWSYEARSASNWPEAFSKQATLCWREHNRYPDQNTKATGDPFDDYFKFLAQANEKALEIWREVEERRQAEIDAIWEAIRNEVADKLASSTDRPEYRQTAEAIREDQLAGYLDW